MDLPKDFEIQSSWVPVTPAIPDRTKRSQVFSSNWLGPEKASSATNVGPDSWGRSYRGQASEAALTSASGQTLAATACSHNGGEMRTTSFDHHKQMPHRSLLASSDPAITSNMTNLPPYLLAQIPNWGSDSQMMPPASPRQNRFIVSGNSLSDLIVSRSDHLPPRPQNGLPIPILPNLNSVPKTNMTNTVVSESVLVPPATPANMGKNMRMQELQCPEIIDLIDDTTVEEVMPSLSNPGVSSADMSLQQVEGETQGIDLNKTPEPKPKRKKHRPKVIREDKPAKTPKPVTPNPITPRQAKKTEDSPQGKRKYVRKKKDLDFLENPLNGSGTKPVRRSLNFDSEECQTRNAESRVDIVSSNINPDVQPVEGQCMGVLKNPLGGGVSFDLNSSADQFDNGNPSFPQIPNPPPQSSRQGVMSSNQIQDDYIRNVNHMMSPLRMNNHLVAGNHVISPEAWRNLVASDKISDSLLKGTKRDHTLVADSQALGHMHHMQAYNGVDRGSENCDVGRNGAHSPEIYKKLRTENVQNEGMSTSYSTSTCVPGGPKIVHAARNTSKAFTFADAQRFMAYKNLRASERMLDMLAFKQAEMTSNNRLSQASSSSSLKADVGYQSASTPVESSGHTNPCCYQPSTPEKPSGFITNHNITSVGPQARINALAASNRLKLKARRDRKKEQFTVNPMSSATNRLQNGPNSSTTVSSLGREYVSKYTLTRNVNTNDSQLRVSSAQHCLDTSNNEGSGSWGPQLGTVISYRDPVDEIIQRLSCLNIHRESKDVEYQHQNALVPYVGGVGPLVPFEGKKRRPRPKVDLDSESDRVWRLLMGKDRGDGAEEMAADKKKWWEEERRVFSGRAESFIARMHLVQGDRRFSKWKGSVVDSVIGVFLTQNVSDHLSSSAFMSLAARFPLRSNCNSTATNVEKINRPIASDGTISGQDKMSEQQSSDPSSVVIHESEHVCEQETASNHESPVSNTGSSTADYLYSSNLDSHEAELRMDHEPPDSGSAMAVTVTSSTSGVEVEDRNSTEDVVSSQNSVASQTFSKCNVQAAEKGKLKSLLNFDADDLLSIGMRNGANSFTELLNIANNRRLQEMSDPASVRTSSNEHSACNNQFRFMGNDNMPSLLRSSDYKSNSHFHSIQNDPTSSSSASSLHCYHQNSLGSKFVGLAATSSVDKTNEIEIMDTQSRPSVGNSTKVMIHHMLLDSTFASVDTYAPISERPVLPITSSGSEVLVDTNSCCQTSVVKEVTQASNTTISSRLLPSGEKISMLQQRESETCRVGSCQHEVKAQAQMGNDLTPQTFPKERSNQEKRLEGVGAVEPNFSQTGLAEASKNASKAKKVKQESDKKMSFDWDSLRRQTCCNGAKKERSSDAMDSLDYEALRNTDVNEIAHAIRERGMNNMLAERIKEFLNRLVRDHGSIDLEWLREVPPDKTKDYLLSIRGLGLKSVECVRLLTLHHLAFPVDTNVGRIAVRLGWVPLQPLPESLQLHLLEMYPVLETIQKYLWPRLCKLDQRTLYELHYQLITFGKVFCTKSKPNCNACPMRGECKHFASAFASARLALPGPEERSLVSSTNSSFPKGSNNPVFKSVPLPRLEGNTRTQDQTGPRNCEPIIEEPASPEQECMGTLESEIEDAFFYDPDEIPTIKLNMEEFTQNLQSYMEQNNIDLQDGDMSKALVAITPEAASIPMAKLKNVSRLRTEHQVYELPDSHPLLAGLDRRERDDPSPYLLAIWTPGETAQSTEPPKVCCSSDTGNLCMAIDCFSCNSIREARAQLVRGTILIPCRTAMRGSFPLNGTYFQVNEVFADHDSSRNPIDVPRNWIWNLPRRTVYFGTSVPTIFKGLTTEGIQQCFWRGFVCVRGFDRTTRRPRPLYARLHFPASKTTKDKRAAAEAEEEAEAKEKSSVCVDQSGRS